jgi:3-hydroxy acid dehydrogenase / malonic semialdehyde reductase
MPKTVLITGATSGFGKACAQLFAQHGHQLIITGRRANRLQDLQTALTTQFNIAVHRLCFDVQDRPAVEAAIASLPANFQTIDVLVNNAGLALGRERFDVAAIEDWDTMIDTNVKGLLYVSKAVLPLMKQAGKGHIINIGSTAAKEVYENGNVYCASKSAVDAISRAMRIDLLPYKIKVTAIHPGAADTEFSLVRFKGNQDKADATYKGFQPLVAEDIAHQVYHVTNLPDHVCINDLVMTCMAQANSFYLFKEA